MENFLLEIEEKYKNKKNIWDGKVEKFLIGFEYLNNESLIKEHMGKILCIGIKSLEGAAELIKTLTNENIKIIENTILSSINKIKELNEKFDILENSLSNKKSVFSFINNKETFLQIFEKEESNINDIIRDLQYKKNEYGTIKESLIEGVEQLKEIYLLLERDKDAIEKIERKIKNNKEIVIKIFKDYEFELQQIRIDVLTQQQIVLQKYTALNILLKNTINCENNINKITQMSYSAIMNTVEVQKIVSLKTNNENNKSNIDNLKNSLKNTKEQIKLILNDPFKN